MRIYSLWLRSSSLIHRIEDPSSFVVYTFFSCVFCFVLWNKCRFSSLHLLLYAWTSRLRPSSFCLHFVRNFHLNSIIHFSFFSQLASSNKETIDVSTMESIAQLNRATLRLLHRATQATHRERERTSLRRRGGKVDRSLYEKDQVQCEWKGSNTKPSLYLAHLFSSSLTSSPRFNFRRKSMGSSWFIDFSSLLMSPYSIDAVFNNAVVSLCSLFSLLVVCYFCCSSVFFVSRWLDITQSISG